MRLTIIIRTIVLFISSKYFRIERFTNRFADKGDEHEHECHRDDDAGNDPRRFEIVGALL